MMIMGEVIINERGIGTLLNDFGAAVRANTFGSGTPTDLCVYHLFTGRQPSGVAGLAWVLLIII